MKNRILLILLALLLATSMVAIGCPPAEVDPVPEPPVPEVFRWRFQVLWDPGTAPFAVEKEFVERVKELSGGRLILELFPPGALVPTMEMHDAVSKGVFELMKTFDPYYMGKEPGLVFLASVAGGFTEAWQYEVWFWELGGIELARRAYKPFNMFYIAPTVYGPEFQHSRVPIRSLADYEGLKARFVGMALSVAERLGIAVTPMPTAEVYSALEKGIIDFADRGGLAANWDAGLQEVTEYIIKPGWHQPATATSYVANMDAWLELPDDLQAILEAAARETSAILFARNHVLDFAALEKFKGHGIEVLTLPEADVMEIRRVAIEVWAEYAAKSPLAKEIYESQMDYMRLLGLVE